MNKKRFSGLLAGITAMFSLAGAPMNAENVSSGMASDEGTSVSSTLSETVENDTTGVDNQQGTSDSIPDTGENADNTGTQPEGKTDYWAESKNMAKKAGNWFGGAVNSVSKKAVNLAGGDWDSYSEESKAGVNAGVGVVGTTIFIGFIALMRSLLSGGKGKGK